MKKIIMFSLCMLIAINAYAQTVIKLKSGTSVEGELIEQTDEYIKIGAFGVTLTYWMDEIESIESEENIEVKGSDDQEISNKRILIKGKVIFDYYTKGDIFIVAFDSPNPQEAKAVSLDVIIPRPGPYTLSLPSSTKSPVYVQAYNDSDNDGTSGWPEPHDPRFFYGIYYRPEPIPLDKPVINNINLTLPIYSE